MSSPSPVRVVSVAAMQEMERGANAAGHSYAAMMERAGHAVAQAVLGASDLPLPAVLVLCGPGNNLSLIHI